MSNAIGAIGVAPSHSDAHSVHRWLALSEPGVLSALFQLLLLVAAFVLVDWDDRLQRLAFVLARASTRVSPGS